MNIYFYCAEDSLTSYSLTFTDPPVIETSGAALAGAPG